MNGRLEAIIEVLDITKVLTLSGNKVELKTRVTPTNETQKWTLGQRDGDGWQTIQHSKTSLYLTTKYKKKGTILTAENKSKFL